MKKLMLVCAVCSLLLTACKKDKTDYVTDSYAYFPMKTGNYWVYKWFHVDSSGNETTLAWNNDTIEIVGDTIINAHTFYKVDEKLIGGAQHRVRYLRDSAMWMVDETGEIEFTVEASAQNFSPYTSTGVPYTSISHMNYSAPQKNVPAGSFPTITKVTTITIDQGTFCNGTNQRSTVKGYGRNVGLTFYTNFYIADPNCEFNEARLVEYHLQ